MSTPNQLPIKQFEGQWDSNVSWEFYLSGELPDPELCTAVYCLAIIDGTPENVVLARNKRGWEMLGGHIEPGEAIEAALTREALEEGGFDPSNFQLFGFRKVIAIKPVVNDHHGGTYPPVAFIPHFIATTNQPLLAPTGEEIFESRVFKVSELPSLEASQEAIIFAGLTAFRNLQKEEIGH